MEKSWYSSSTNLRKLLIFSLFLILILPASGLSQQFGGIYVLKGERVLGLVHFRTGNLAAEDLREYVLVVIGHLVSPVPARFRNYQVAPPPFRADFSSSPDRPWRRASSA